MVIEVDIVVGSSPQFIYGCEDVSVEELVLEDRPKTFSAGVFEARTGLAHGASDFELGAQLLDLMATDLATAA